MFLGRPPGFFFSFFWVPFVEVLIALFNNAKFVSETDPILPIGLVLGGIDIQKVVPFAPGAFADPVEEFLGDVTGHLLVDAQLLRLVLGPDEVLGEVCLGGVAEP